MTEEPKIIEIAAKAKENIQEEMDEVLPKNWKQALAGLIASRSAILKIEGIQAASDFVIKLAFVIPALFGLFLSWILLIAGVIGVISTLTPMNWWQASFVVAGGHILVAIGLLLAAKSIGSTSFPVSRNEFKKDREWLNQL